jgi:hypothetical protein
MRAAGGAKNEQRRTSKGSRMNKTAALLSAAALTAPLALSAQTLDLPPRRAGLWEITTAIEKPKSMPAVTAQMCLDRATDREMMDYALKLTDGKCKSITTKREGNSIIVDADCTFAGKPTKSRTVLTGDLQSAYTVRTEGTVADGKSPQARVVMQTATWKGTECPGMTPGDISMFGGIKVNIKQIKALSGLIR